MGVILNKLKKETKQIWAHYIKNCAKKTVNMYVYDFSMYELLVTCELQGGTKIKNNLMKNKKAIAVTIQQNQLQTIRLFGGDHLIRSIGKMVKVLRQDNDRIKHFFFFVF